MHIHTLDNMVLSGPWCQAEEMSMELEFNVKKSGFVEDIHKTLSFIIEYTFFLHYKYIILLNCITLSLMFFLW